MAYSKITPLGSGEFALTKENFGQINDAVFDLKRGAVTRYRMVSNGTTVSAYDHEGVLLSSNTDGGAVLTAILPAASSAGATIDFRNDGLVFPWGSVPALPKGITKKLLIRGHGALVQLSSGGSRFLDFVRGADFDTFQNIEVTDFLIDCNSIDAATHTIIGTRNGVGANDRRINVADLTIRRVRAINIPSTATVRSGISIATSHVAGAEGTQTSIKRVLIEDVRIEGGISGIVITGGPSGATTNLNQLIDQIEIVRCSHTQPSQTVSPVSGACLQMGQNSPVGYVHVKDFYGEYCKDVGIEIDNALVAKVETSVISNCKSAYLATNFATTNAQQDISFRDCTAVVTDAAVVNNNGWLLFPNNSLALGTVTLEDCALQQTNGNIPGDTGATAAPINCSTALVMRRLNIRRFKCNVESINYNSGSNIFLYPILLKNLTAEVVIDNCDIRSYGSISGAGKVTFAAVMCRPTSVLNVRLDTMTVDYSITGMGAFNGTFAFDAGVGAAGLTLSGSVRRLRILSLGDDSGAKGIRVGNTTNTTIAAPPFLIEDCDFAGMTAPPEVSVDSTQTALGAVLTRSNRWKTKPVPVGLTGLVTATGKRLGAAGAGVVWRCLVQLTQGSGAAITAVDYSSNDGTTYTNLLTQGSAALPAGLGPVVGPLTPDALLKATFTTTQPTVTLVPVDP